MGRYTPLSVFSTAFAAEYRGWAAAHDVTQDQIAATLDRNRSYVSERMSGKRALDTEDVDALASLTGQTGQQLIVELARRAQSRIAASNIRQLPTTRTGQRPPFEVDELKGAAYDQSDGEVGDVEEP